MPDGTTILVALSGGADSRALLELCRDEAPGRNWRLRIGHVDHALRSDSGDHATWVRELGRSLGCPSLGARVSSRFWTRTQGRSLEDAAREVRRRALRRMARRAGAASVFLGHSADDQAETLLLHLLRGTGIRGMAGMEVRSGRLVRPLLGVRRAELRAFLRRRGAEWREDPSNEDARFLRNRIRRELLPLLEDRFQPGIVEVLGRSAGAFRSVRAWLRTSTDAAWADLSPECGPAWIRLDRPRLASYDRAVIEEILRRAYHELRGSARDIRHAHVRSLAAAVVDARPRRFDLPGRVCAQVDAASVCLEQGQPRAPHHPVIELADDR